jgi:hypothetical protein
MVSGELRHEPRALRRGDGTAPSLIREGCSGGNRNARHMVAGNQQQSADSDSSSSAKDQPGLVEEAERLLGTITGRSAGSMRALIRNETEDTATTC